MCGVAGAVTLDAGARIAPDVVPRMLAALAHRGPDDSGDVAGEGVHIGARRLAIMDLSPRGHMPMQTDDGRFTLVHNGEIYNHRELRRELEQRGHHFRSTSDTEVLLRLFVDEGPAMLARCNGMFAIAVWDAERRELFLARDRLGVKPLYYAIERDVLWFSSEQRSLFEGPLAPELDDDTWDELLVFRYVAGGRTPYRGVRRLLPGHWMRVADGRCETRRWWSLDDAVSNGDDATPEALRHLILDSARLRVISDVPVGVLLSGGIDSTAVAAAMPRPEGHESYASFTVAFRESGYDESARARATAARLGLAHHEIILDDADRHRQLERAATLLGEPLVHWSDPHLLAISERARPLVTVLLSGEGGDELFGGYLRYLAIHRAGAIRAATPLLARVSRRRVSGRVGKALAIANADDTVFSSAEIHPASLGLDPDPARFEFRARVAERARALYGDSVRRAMFYDQHTYLQSVLDRNDRMTMGASIECRVPLLDYRIVELAARARTKDLIGLRRGKLLLRRAMRDCIPRVVLRGRKWGFGVPWTEHLRSDPTLRGLVAGLPTSGVVRSSPLAPSLVAGAVGSFLAGSDEHAPLVRNLLAVHLWHATCIERDPHPVTQPSVQT